MEMIVEVNESLNIGFDDLKKPQQKALESTATISEYLVKELDILNKIADIASLEKSEVKHYDQVKQVLKRTSLICDSNYFKGNNDDVRLNVLLNDVIEMIKEFENA